MYLAKFEGDSEPVVQGVVHLVKGAPLSLPLLHQLLAAPVDVAYRVQTEKGNITQTLLIHGEQREQRALYELLEKLTGVEECTGCANADEHDQRCAEFPDNMGWIDHRGYRTGPFQLTDHFKLFGLIPSLFATALQQHWRVAFQVNLRRYRFGRDELGQLKKFLLHLESERNIPEPVVQLQRSIVQYAQQCDFLADELIGCQEQVAWDHVQRLVDESFSGELSRLGFTHPPFEQKGADELVQLGFHSSLLTETLPLVKASGALTRAEVMERLQWSRPSTPVAHPNKKAIFTPQSAYDVFLSYSSKDYTVAQTVCLLLEESGIRCWMAPRDILPGEAYPEAIIRGINGVKIMVLLFSDSSNFSQHVQREVERALNRNITVIPFRISSILPTGAMEYLISTCHWLDATAPPLHGHVHTLREVVRRFLQA